MTATRSSGPVTASPRLRRVMLVVGSVFTVLALAGTVLNLFNQVARHSYTVTHSIEEAALGGVSALEARNSAGSTTITGSSRSDVALTADVVDGLFSADHRHELRADRLRVTGGCRWAFATHCRVDHHLQVPEGFLVEARNRHGDLTLAHLSGPVRTDVRFGALRGDDLHGAVEIDHGFGRVELDGIESQRVSITQRFGEVTVAFVDAPEEIVLDLRFGDAVIELPDDGGAYDVRASSSFGERDIRVRTDASSNRTIRVDHEFGDVTIRYAP